MPFWFFSDPATLITTFYTGISHLKLLVQILLPCNFEVHLCLLLIVYVLGWAEENSNTVWSSSLFTLSFLTISFHYPFTVLTDTGSSAAAKINALKKPKEAFSKLAMIESTLAHCGDGALYNAVFTVKIKFCYLLLFTSSSNKFARSIPSSSLSEGSTVAFLLKRHESVKWCVIGSYLQCSRSISVLR